MFAEQRQMRPAVGFCAMDEVAHGEGEMVMNRARFGNISYAETFPTEP
jgi:hypothetical protein